MNDIGAGFTPRCEHGAPVFSCSPCLQAENKQISQRCEGMERQLYRISMGQPRFENVSCSQCGCDFGHGDVGLALAGQIGDPWPSRSVSVMLAGVEYEAEVEWFGTYSPATRLDPEEFPEPILVSCKRDGLDYSLDYLTVEAEEKLMARACDSADENEDDDYDGPSDDDLSDYYGGGGARPMSEQYAEAIEAKKKLG